MKTPDADTPGDAAPDGETPERVRGWPGGTRKSRELPLTAGGKIARDRLRSRLNDMHSKAALVRAHRRRATAQDTTDFDAAFDELVNPQGRPIWVNATADAMVILASFFIGYGTNIATGDDSNAGRGWLAILPGILLAVFATVVRYIKPG